MNKVYGNLKEFTPIRSDRSRLIISYNCQVEKDNIHATWCEIYFYKKPHPYVSDEEMAKRYFFCFGKGCILLPNIYSSFIYSFYYDIYSRNERGINV